MFLINPHYPCYGGVAAFKVALAQNARGRTVKMHIALLYSFFAVVSTVCNIGAQDAAIRLYAGPHSVALSVMIGTGVGLVVKYVLDKRYIFRYRTANALHDTRLFILYTAMGLATTAVFWGFEFGFDAVFHTKEMRYLGGVTGLAIGYWVKYHLDKRFVFTGRPAGKDG